MLRARVGGSTCSVELEVCDQCLPRVEGRRIIASKLLIDLDANLSVLGESLAGLLLAKVDGGDGWLAETTARYRLRVMAEELLGLRQAFDGLVDDMRVDPLYAGARRAWLLGEPYWGLFSSSAGLDREYDSLARSEGLILEGKVSRAAVSRLSERIRVQAKRLLSGVSLRMGRIARRLASSLLPAIRGLDCPGAPEYDAGLYVSLPEGRYYEGDAQGLLEKLRGPVRCRRPTVLSSSLVCEAGGERFVVKRYAAREAKWLPASFASPAGARMSVSAASRVAREYTMLRRLRGVVRTPRVVAIVREGMGPVMVREYIPGRPVLESKHPDDWRLAGGALARIHSAGFALLDSNPGNFLATDEGAALIDAEQADAYTDEAGAWDLVVFVAYAILFGADRGLVLEALRAYRETAPELFDRLRELARSDRIAGRLKLMAYPVYQSTVRVLESV